MLRNFRKAPLKSSFKSTYRRFRIPIQDPGNSRPRSTVHLAIDHRTAAVQEEDLRFRFLDEIGCNLLFVAILGFRCFGRKEK